MKRNTGWEKLLVEAPTWKFPSEHPSGTFRADNWKLPKVRLRLYQMFPNMTQVNIYDENRTYNQHVTSTLMAFNPIFISPRSSYAHTPPFLLLVVVPFVSSLIDEKCHQSTKKYTLRANNSQLMLKTIMGTSERSYVVDDDKKRKKWIRARGEKA